MKKLLALIILLMLIVVGCNNNSETSGKGKTEFPERSIEFVACYGPGGGHDTMLRTMQRIIQDNSIVSDTINVVNKEGGSGSVGMGYTNSHKGDGHYLMSATNSFITTPLQSDVGVSYKDFTPIARLGLDPSIVIVNSQSEYDTLDKLVKCGKILNCGGTGQGTLEHVVCGQIAKLSGIEINYIPYQGDAEVVTALLGGQIDMAISNPSTSIDYVRSGDFKALAISTEERVEIMPDLPTFKEQGFDITSSLFRGVVAPAGISEEAKQYYIDMLTEMVKTDEWKKDYLEQNAIVDGFLIGEEFGEFLDTMNSTYEVILTDLGIIE